MGSENDTNPKAGVKLIVIDHVFSVTVVILKKEV